MRKWSLVLGLAVLLASSPDAARSSFSDATRDAGLAYLQHNAPAWPDCLVPIGGCEPERMSGGAAVADVDGDGDLDLLVTRLDAPDVLFENQGDGSFSDATAASGLAAYDLQSNGAAFGDIDNDGDPDLVVTVLGAPGDPVNNRNYLFVNDGSGVFTEEAIPRGVDDTSAFGRLVWSVSFGDYDRDGLLDLHVNEWGNGAHTRLFRNEGAGYFVDATDSAELALSAIDAFASTFIDLDGDGWQDLAIAADFGTSRLFWNDGDGTFTDGTAGAGVGTDENGMGSTFGDFDGDGDLDWFVTSIHDPAETCELHPCNWSYSGNRLYRNEGGRAFSDATDAAGVRAGYWGWGAAFFDWENDADLDLVMTNGVEFPKELWEDAFNTDPMRLWRNDGTGNMVEVSAGEGITDTRSGKGLLVFDYDSDGDLDLFVVNNAAGPTLYRNEQAPGNAWLRLRVRGSISNRDGIGSQVRVWRSLPGPPQVREVGAASHFVGQSEPELHFGLGAGIATVARIEVFFPASGVTVVRRDVVVNQTITIEEPSAAVPGPGLGLSIGLAGLLLACGRSAVQLVKAGRADARRDLR